MSICKNILKTFEKGNKTVLGYKNNNNIWNKIDNNKLSCMINSCNEILKDNNIQKGDRVVYCGSNSVEWVAWNLSCYSIGGIWVPIYNNQPTEYCNHIINDCEPKLFISDTEMSNINNTTKILNKIHKSNKEFTIKDTSELATLIYTSGTTGPPKGVKLTHNNILSNIEGINNRFYDLKDYKSLNILPWAHIYSLTCELYYNLLNSNETYICNDKTNFIKDCKEVSPDVIYVVPKLLEIIKTKIEFLDKPLIKIILPYILNKILGNNLKIIFMGGAKLDNETKNFYQDNGIIICEGYGCTETSPIISVNHHSEPRDINSIGKILDNVEVKIINDELCVSGPSIMDGYWNDNEKTEKNIFIDNRNTKWYKTGDSGYIKNEFIYYTGRISENYKLNNGKFVNVNEIESIIKKYIKGNFIVYSQDNKTNTIITDTEINNKTLSIINKNLSSYLKIINVIKIDEEEMSKFMTPKLSIKRNQLIKYIKF